MTFADDRRSARFWFGLLTLVSLFFLLFLVVFAPPDGHERTQWLHFLGDFHPIAVHLPIAILVLVPLIELAGRSRFFPQVLSAVDFLLGVAICSAIAAVSLGWCLARSGSYSGSLVKQHMWGGILVALAAWLCWVLHARSTESRRNRQYAAVLLVTVGLVSFTGYRGGQLSQGENHLTEHMPDGLRRWLGMEAFANASTSAYGGPATFYGARVQPIFSQHCVGCHGQSKHKANLRLDRYEAVMRGSKHGPVVKAGNLPDSELFRRITLPPTDDDFMPAEHKPALSSNEIKRIEVWISSGASGTLITEAIKDTASGLFRHGHHRSLLDRDCHHEAPPCSPFGAHKDHQYHGEGPDFTRSIRILESVRHRHITRCPAGDRSTSQTAAPLRSPDQDFARGTYSRGVEKENHFLIAIGGKKIGRARRKCDLPSLTEALPKYLILSTIRLPDAKTVYHVFSGCVFSGTQAECR
jgi:uncharacterized membrane protein